MHHRALEERRGNTMRLLHRAPPGPLLQRPADLSDSETTIDRLLRLSNARVIFADHGLLQRDFPRLADERFERDPEIAALPPVARQEAIRRRIEAWLLDQAAFVSERQAAQDHVNTPIALTGEEKRAFRPPRYGRAAVVRTGDGPGLLDLKGIGVGPGCAPQRAPYETGLLIARGAFQEVLFQWMIDAIFDGAAPDLFTVPIYGVLDPGFLAYQPGQDAMIPAAILIRRAHRRPLGGVELPRPGGALERLKFEVEMLLRSYGFTSSSHATQLHLRDRDGRVRVLYGGSPMRNLHPLKLEELRRRFGPLPASYDGVNVQLALHDGQPGVRALLVDFGQFEYRTHFDMGVTSLVYSQWLPWRGALRPEHPAFVQPDPSLRLPEEDWATPALKEFLEVISSRLHGGEFSGEAVRAGIEARIARAVAHWRGEGVDQAGASGAGITREATNAS